MGFSKTPPVCRSNIWLVARSDFHILTQHRSLHLLQESYHDAQCRATETNQYKGTETKFRPVVSWAHHMNATI